MYMLARGVDPPCPVIMLSSCLLQSTLDPIICCLHNTDTVNRAIKVVPLDKEGKTRRKKMTICSSDLLVRP